MSQSLEAPAPSIVEPQPSAAPPSAAAPSPGPAAELGATQRFAALHARNFRLIWIGLLVSNAGYWMEATATSWLVTDLKPERASFWLGVLAAAFAVPMLLLPPIGGAIADRWSRLRMLWVVQTVYLFLSAALTALTLTDRIEIWMLAAYAFLMGVVLAIDSPVRHALLPELVTRGQLPSAVSLNSVAFTGAAMVGPAIAGALIPVLEVGGVFAMRTLSCVATLAALWQLDLAPSRSEATHAAEGVLRSIAAGVRYVRASRLIATLMLISVVSGLFARSYTPLLAVFARDEFEVGSGAYGLLVSAGGLGAIIGAFGLAGRRDVERKTLLIVGALSAQALALLAFSATPWYGFALPLLLLSGLANALYGATTATLIQLTVPGELRGRVMSLYLLTLIGIPSVGSFVVGAWAELAGVRLAIGLASFLVIGSLAVILARNRAFVAATPS